MACTYITPTCSLLIPRTHKIKIILLALSLSMLLHVICKPHTSNPHICTMQHHSLSNHNHAAFPPALYTHIRKPQHIHTTPSLPSIRPHRATLQKSLTQSPCTKRKQKTCPHSACGTRPLPLPYYSSLAQQAPWHEQISTPYDNIRWKLLTSNAKISVSRGVTDVKKGNTSAS